MEELPGAGRAGELLKTRALRDFGPWQQSDKEIPAVSGRRLALPPDQVPVPLLLKYALELIGLEAYGPAEKVAWWIEFAYKGDLCQLSHEKFGVRLALWSHAPEEVANRTLNQIAGKLRSATRTVEHLIADAAPEILGHGAATVVNQHHSLQRAYQYFRDRALSPDVIESEQTTWDLEGGGTGTSFIDGPGRMRMNAFHDLVAALTAYLSLLEHDLVLALAFTDFDPEEDNLTKIIGDRWSEKFARVLGNQGEAAQLRQRLAEVVERWRNPYSHGGNDKRHGASIYLHAAGIGAVPVGLTKIRDSPLFTFVPADETDVDSVFALLDEIDTWIDAKLTDALQWIREGLAVPFSEAFREEAAAARTAGVFAEFVRYHSYRQDMIDNMDF
ncbi:MAG TPA: hypothetical protein VFG33_13735 [Kribbella sp.]|uniref:hypothetical protein n=1 Tax=Kribbella sp. TaxID=1871183 RepID=UPI002D7A33AA|nr:hypothetical protein [Kribbella sp.]HET6294439.1 hypothetical protein [Kribbella sp.]